MLNMCKGALASPMKLLGHTKYTAAMIVVLFEGIFHAVIPRTISDKRCKREREAGPWATHDLDRSDFVYIRENLRRLSKVFRVNEGRLRKKEREKAGDGAYT